QFESALVAGLESRVLSVLFQKAIADCEHIDLSAHKAAEGVFRRADQGLAANIEAGVHNDRTAGQTFEGADQRVIARVSLFMDRLDPRRVVDMSDGRDLRSRDVQLVDPEQRLLLLAHRAAPPLEHIRDDEHVRTVCVQLEPIAYILAQNRRSKRTERFPEFYLKVQQRLHLRRACVTQYGTSTEG